MTEMYHAVVVSVNNVYLTLPHIFLRTHIYVWQHVRISKWYENKPSSQCKKWPITYVLMATV